MLKQFQPALTKIIAYFCLFFALFKIILVFQNKRQIEANLIIVLALIVFGITGLKLLQKRNYPLIYVIAGSLFIILLRFYQQEWVEFFGQYF